jgi:hypothetical protein
MTQELDDINSSPEASLDRRAPVEPEELPAPGDSNASHVLTNSRRVHFIFSFVPSSAATRTSPCFSLNHSNVHFEAHGQLLATSVKTAGTARSTCVRSKTPGATSRTESRSSLTAGRPKKDGASDMSAGSDSPPEPIAEARTRRVGAEGETTQAWQRGVRAGPRAPRSGEQVGTPDRSMDTEKTMFFTDDFFSPALAREMRALFKRASPPPRQSATRGSTVGLAIWRPSASRTPPSAR